VQVLFEPMRRKLNRYYFMFGDDAGLAISVCPTRTDAGGARPLTSANPLRQRWMGHTDQ